MRACRVDANHNDISDGLRAYGFSVLSLARLGRGAPDILVGTGAHNVLIEIKVKSGKLNEAQKEFFACWRGPKAVVRSLDEALAVIDSLTKPSLQTP